MAVSYLEKSYFFDYEAESIQELISEFIGDESSLKEKAIGMYNKVRDGWLYDPYHISMEQDNYRASELVKRPSGNCVEKSIILIAGLRALGIPARLHLGKVKNHIAVERLTEKFGSNELTPHGMVNAQINRNWLKMSPAFNASLCEKFNVDPLEFDGENNSFLQEFNKSGSQFMEYTDDYGFFDDVPVDFMVQNLKDNYPHIFDVSPEVKEFRL